MKKRHPMTIAPNVILGGGQPVLFAGPCALESLDIALQTAVYLRDMTRDYGVPLVFKVSFDKANRTSHHSFRSIGFAASLEALKQIRREVDVPILTDIHETVQIDAVAAVVDILQIPAFLCRQTDLLQGAGRTGLPVNIKRGQFMSPESMAHAVDKVKDTGNQQVFLTERGVSFGYNNLVVDMRALPMMRQYAPVIFDVTHSVQTPGGQGSASGGQREFAPYLARAAAAVGVDGFFIETHPNPTTALSDGPNMIPLDELPALLEMILAVWQAARQFV